MAGVRRDEVDDAEEVPDAFGPKALGDPLQTNWAMTRYVAVDLMGLGGDQLAERLGQHVGRGRELGHVDLRPRALAQPLDPGQLRQPVRRHAAARVHRHVGHDEPRHVQRPGRPPHPLPDPADAGLRARLAAQHPQQALPELRQRRRPGAPEPQRARAVGHRGRRRDRARGPARHGRGRRRADRARRHGRRQLDAVHRGHRLALRRRAPPATTITGKYNALHDGGRPADRLGLVRPGPRRGHQQGQEQLVELRRRASTASSG